MKFQEFLQRQSICPVCNTLIDADFVIQEFNNRFSLPTDKFSFHIALCPINSAHIELTFCSASILPSFHSRSKDEILTITINKTIVIAWQSFCYGRERKTISTHGQGIVGLFEIFFPPNQIQDFESLKNLTHSIFLIV